MEKPPTHGFELGGAITILAHSSFATGGSVIAIGILLFLVALVRLRVAWAGTLAIWWLVIAAAIALLTAVVSADPGAVIRALFAAGLAANLVVAIVRTRARQRPARPAPPSLA